LDGKVEGAFVCCAAALEAWNESDEDYVVSESVGEDTTLQKECSAPPVVEWITAREPLVDRKSSFLAMACKVASEQQVHDALRQLINGSSKLQRASHIMVRTTRLLY
jgi:hypothetical protein